MIRAYTGLPRAGKSYGALIDQKTEMCHGKRTIWHNMVIDHGELAAYCQKQGYEPDFSTRINHIPHEDVRRFWQYAKEHGTENGRFFVIDEAHIFFDARAWAEVGKEMSVYLTQHGHMNDEILFITQHPEMLDKRIRLLIAQTTVFRNLRTERWFQWFRPPSWMLWSEYFGLPKHGQKPDAIGKRKIEPALAKCYKTSVGHGGLGASGAPEQDRPTKRLNWFWLAIPAAALLVAATFGPQWVLEWTLGRATKGVSTIKTSAPGRSEVPAAVVSSPVAVAPVHVQPQAPPAGTATEEPRPQVTLKATGILADLGKLMIVLSDGRVITEQDKPYRKSGYIYWDEGRERALLVR